MTQDVMAFVAGSYGTAVLILGGLAIGTLIRFRSAARRLTAVETSRPQRRRARRG